MCSVLELLDMDNNQGDLTDVVRGIGSGHVSASHGPAEGPSPPLASDLHVDLPSFGDPFVSTTDPLLLLHPTANSDDNKSNNTFAIFPKAFEEDHHIKCTSIFPRIRISQSINIHDASTCNSPAVSAAAASPWGMINNNNNNNNNASSSSSSQIQISSSSPRNLGIKRRKSQAKKVVCIPAPAAMNSRSSGEVVPSDLWAWRKYGQKPIKGSPFPRGYYRCSSSKGCSARKQVERSRTDPNMLVITYTSEHNHPWPTQRNALAGSTRSSPNSCSKSSTATATTSASPKVSQNIIYNESHLTSSSSPHPPCAAITVKEERQQTMDVTDTYRPEFQHQPEDFFADLGELEGDSLTMLLSQGFVGNTSGVGYLENKTTMPDTFSDFLEDDDSPRSS